MKGDKRSWLLYQVSPICMCISWLLLLPIALSFGAGENLGTLMVPKHGTTDPCIGVFIGVKPFWGCRSHLSCSLLLLLKIGESFCPCPAQLAGSPAKAEPALYSSMSACPSSRPSRPGWCSAPLCVPMATAEPLCSALGNFPLSRPPPCNKLSQSDFPAQPLVGIGTVLVLPAPESQPGGWRSSPVWGICMPTLVMCHVSWQLC